MPELPSVEIYKHYFDRKALKQRIESLEISSPEMLVDTSPQEMEKCMLGQMFVGSQRYGKYLFGKLANNTFLVIHFGMTGYLHYGSLKMSGHPRLVLTFSNGNHLIFDDTRKFGKLGLTGNPDLFVTQKKLGPDALIVDIKTFYKIFQRRTGMIKPLILNQNLIAGIGNLYADEILYQSRVHPQTPAHHLKLRDWERLFKETKKVLKIAIKYQDRPKALPNRFLLPHRYKGGTCPEGGKVEIIKVGGRTTYICPKKQKIK
jgi:formamidopyrimidine-DNA glycosylase